MDSPNVKTEKPTEITVAKGLNIETITGPRFFIAHPLKLTHAPLTIPTYQFQILYVITINKAIHYLC